MLFDEVNVCVQSAIYSSWLLPMGLLHTHTWRSFVQVLWQEKEMRWGKGLGIWGWKSTKGAGRGEARDKRQTHWKGKGKNSKEKKSPVFGLLLVSGTTLILN